MKKHFLTILFGIAMTVITITSCDTMNNKVTIGNPKEKIKEPIKQSYMALLPDSVMLINDWAKLIDSVLIEHEYRIDSLIYELNK
jgi:hypothetical protein